MNRNNIVHKAREKYVFTGITQNLTEALKMYLENAPEEEQIPLFVTMPEIHKLKELLKTQRPTCDDCGNDLFMRENIQGIDGKIYPTAWACNTCGLIEYSDKTPKEWLEILNENRG
jgi:ribosomal protein S27AE